MQTLAKRLTKLEDRISGDKEPGRIFSVKCGGQTDDEIKACLRGHGFDDETDLALVRKIVRPGEAGPVACEYPISINSIKPGAHIG